MAFAASTYVKYPLMVGTPKDNGDSVTFALLKRKFFIWLSRDMYSKKKGDD
jgi:hypothetical protein